MDQQAIDRLTAKSDRQMLLMELQDYRLSPIEAEAIVQRLQQYLDEHNPDQLGEGQISYPAVAFSEPAGKPVEKCHLVQVKLTLRLCLRIHYEGTRTRKRQEFDKKPCAFVSLWFFQTGS